MTRLDLDVVVLGDSDCGYEAELSYEEFCVAFILERLLQVSNFRYCFLFLPNML